jgi:hypothetical protein
MAGHCLPIACSHSSWDGYGAPVADNGIYALWESCGDTEEFFGLLGIRSVSSCDDESSNPNGLWVYEVTYDDLDTDVDSPDVPWLEGGKLRRPTIEELRPLAAGKPPWDGLVF